MNRRGISYQTLWIASLGLAIVWLIGCGGSDRPKTIPITGHVTFDGQPPGEVGSLVFTPTETAPGYIKRPASGGFAADGKYRVMSWEPDDGLVPGHYTVSLVPNDLKATKIPEKYQQGGSGLEVDVPVDEDQIEFNIDVVTE
jgi:hypothetical protein